MRRQLREWRNEVRNLHPIRKTIREILAVLFWFHALCAFHVLQLHSFAIPPAFSMQAYNAVLFTFIIYYSYFSNCGWMSVVWDLIYIYAWPMRTAWKLISKTFSVTYHFIKSRSKFPAVGLVIVPTAEPEPQAAESKTLKESVTDLRQYFRDKKSKERIDKLQRALRPVYQFAFLWSLLVMTLQSPTLIVVAAVVTLTGAFRAVYTLWNLLSGTSSYLEKIHSGIATQLTQKIAQVREWEEDAGPEKITGEVNTLKIYESIFGYISDNRVFLAKCTMVLAALITIPFYIYISLLFASVYIGIAHLQHLSLSFGTAFVDSLYIPFAFSDLPHNNLLKLIAGLQAVALTVMGWNIFFRHLSGRFESIAIAAADFRSTMQEESYRKKLSLVAAFASSGTAGVSKKPPTSVLEANGKASKRPATRPRKGAASAEQ
ncbi:MAG TPA: hypothetical protein VK814_07590 [Acidobacteriaceae bacterium]|nr:hypothetical protein [Acidobacteriaceae bacterium]